MMKRRRSAPLLPYTIAKPAQQHSSTSVVFKRSLITITILLAFAFCGHALFSASGQVKSQEEAQAVDATLPLSRERSARGLAEQEVLQKQTQSPVDEVLTPPIQAKLPPQLDAVQSPASPLLQQQLLSPAAQQPLVLSPPVQQAVDSPPESPHRHKQTLQEAHTEAQQHFQHAHPVQTEPALALPYSPAAYGIYAMTVEDIDGNQRPLSEFANKVAVVVNVASSCGFTDSNYKGLQFLYDKYKDYDFTVLAFPCNQFGQQEPGSNQDIKQFAQDKYGITFPIFSKIDVNGPQASQLFHFLKQNMPVGLALPGGGDNNLDWNFNKFLVGRNGMPLKHYQSNLDYAQLEQDVYDELVKAYQQTAR